MGAAYETARGPAGWIGKMQGEGESVKGGDASWPVVVCMTDNCFIRAAPSAAGTVLGVAKRGQILPYGGQISPEGWKLILWRGAPGWVTGRNSVAVYATDGIYCSGE